MKQGFSCWATFSLLLGLGCSAAPEGAPSDSPKADGIPDYLDEFLDGYDLVDRCDVSGLVHLSEPLPTPPVEDLPLELAASNLFVIGDSVFFDLGRTIYAVPVTGGAPHAVYERARLRDPFWAYQSSLVVFEGERLTIIDAVGGQVLREISTEAERGNLVELFEEFVGDLAGRHIVLTPDGGTVFQFIKGVELTFSSEEPAVDWIAIQGVHLDTGEVFWPVEKMDMPYPKAAAADERGALYAILEDKTSANPQKKLLVFGPEASAIEELPFDPGAGLDLYQTLGFAGDRAYAIRAEESIFDVTEPELIFFPKVGGTVTIVGSGVSIPATPSFDQFASSVQQIADKLVITTPTLTWFKVNNESAGHHLGEWWCGRAFATEAGLYSRYGESRGGIGFRSWETILSSANQ